MIQATDPRQRVHHLLRSPAIVRTSPARSIGWTLPFALPADMVAFYEACDGLETADGTVIRGAGEIADLTAWFLLDKGLVWPKGRLIIGERRDSLIVLDVDETGVRAGGGVLELATDDLGMFERQASDGVAYAAWRAGAAEDPDPPAEIRGVRARDEGDVEALARALELPFYPGAELLAASLLGHLGAMLAQRGDDGAAWVAFERSAERRVAASGRGGRPLAERAAWRASAHLARGAGRQELAIRCDARAATVSAS